MQVSANLDSIPSLKTKRLSIPIGTDMKPTQKYVVMKMMTVTTILAPIATQSMQTMAQNGCNVHCAPNGFMKFAFICDSTLYMMSDTRS